MGIKRIVDTSFWTDNKIDDFSPEDKYFMLYLLTNPFSTQLGIYEISIKQVAFHLGYSKDTVMALIERFEKYGIIIFSPTTNEVAIKNFLRHSIIKGGKPVEDCIKKEMSKVKERSLLDRVFNHISDKDDVNETIRKIIVEYEQQNENDNDKNNDNDNENDVSYHDSSTNRSKPKKQKYGEYQKVKLTDAEYEKLGTDFGAELRDKAISFLDAYIEEKGYKSKSHNLAIRRWVIEAVRENETKTNRYGNKKQPITYGCNGFGNAEMEAMKRLMAVDEKPTAGTDPEIADRAEKLKERLGG